MYMEYNLWIPCFIIDWEAFNSVLKEELKWLAGEGSENKK